MLYVFQTRTYDNIDAMDEVLVFKTEAERTAYIAEFEKAIAENDMIFTMLTLQIYKQH